ncbi:MAG: hypothetical protein RIQ60_3975 [Pseudomonadota bacterium]|jgi:hypothetical protein
MMKRLLTLFCLLLFTQFALAELPTQAEVEAAVRASRYSEAQAMMAEVVKAKPASAKARYVYAEILAHNRQYDDAATQLREAQRIDPATKFADPGRVQAFEQQLQRAAAKAHQPGSLAGTGAVIGAPPQAGAQAPAAQVAPGTGARLPAEAPVQRAARTEASDGGGLPGWLIIVAIFGVGIVVLRSVTKRQREAARQSAIFPAQAAGWSGGTAAGAYPPSGYGAPSAGSSALRTGMAVAGGVAAGVLLERMLHGNEAHAVESSSLPQHVNQPQLQPPAGGDDFGFERREIDFGHGGGWDSGGDGGGDSGGDGAGDGGW